MGSSAWIKERSLYVGGDGAIERGFVPRLDRPQFGNAGIQERAIKLSEFAPQRLGDVCLRCHVARVRWDHEHAAPQFRASTVKRFWVSPGNCNAGALLKK